MPRIFISYRRGDSAGHAGRLYDRLVDHFDQQNVFMDVDTIQPGLDFVNVVQEAVGSCDSLIAVIGREWLGASDGSGRRRLENPEDLVRLEIATALARNIRVIPVLVQDAREPLATELPDELKPLSRRNSLELSDTRFRADVERLIEVLQTPTPDRSTGSPFVGRQREMGELKVALDETIAGRGRVVMLAGEPGIGKTRTAQELATHAETLGALVLWGWCYEEEGAPAYWPWVQPLRSYVQQADPEQLTSEMGPGAADIAEIIPELREKLPELERPPSLAPEQARFRLFQSIVNFLIKSAQSRPLMLVLDDLHWADRSSLLLLQFVAREMSRIRLMVVGTYRDVELSRQHPLSETLAQLTRQPVFQRELLRGLSYGDTGRFIEATAGIRPAPELVETIYAHTEGNPFFMEEVVRLLSESEELTSGDIQVLRIPEGVREVIGQRLNRLSGQCNETLTTASVIGREFDFRLLAMLSDGISEDALGQAISEAVDAHMLEEIPGGWERYRFSHALVQETLSAELQARRKVRLHARIGEALESLYGADVRANADELARHFGEAEPVIGPEKLVHYSLLAGEQALATYAWEEALGHFQRGINANQGQPVDADTAAVLFGLGRAQAATLERQRIQQVVDTLSQAFDYYAAAGDSDRAVAVAEYPFYPPIGQHSGNARLIARALDLVSPDTQAAARLLSRYGRVKGLEEGDYDGAREAFTRALSIAQREGDSALEMRTLADAGNVDMIHVHYQESLVTNTRAIQLAQSADDPYAEALAHYNSVLVQLALGDLAEMRLHASAMLAPAEKLRDRFLLTMALRANQDVAHVVGDWQTARDFSDRALALSPLEARNLCTRALLEYQAGDFDLGETYLRRVVETMRSTPPGPTIEHAFAALAIPLIARITGSMDLLDVAETSAETVLSSASKIGHITLFASIGLAVLATCLNDASRAKEQYAALESRCGTFLPFSMVVVDRVLGLLASTMGNLHQAISHYEEALVLCRRARYRPELAWTCCDYADALLQRNEPGDGEKARSLLDESLAISSELDMRPLKERILSRR